MKHTSLLRFTLVGIIFFTVGCTKLTEKVLDESSVTGLTQKQLADGIIAPVYAGLPSLFQHTTYFALQEISTDEAILPYRGGTDWGDNGIYVALHRHELTSTDPNVRNTWNIITISISRALTAINSLKENTEYNSFNNNSSVDIMKMLFEDFIDVNEIVVVLKKNNNPLIWPF